MDKRIAKSVRSRTSSIASTLKRRGVTDNVTVDREYITAELILEIYKQFRNCENCGKPFGTGFRELPTIDRIVPEKGYVRGNLAALCAQCNRRKQDSSPADLRKLADFIESKLANPTVIEAIIDPVPRLRYTAGRLHDWRTKMERIYTI